MVYNDCEVYAALAGDSSLWFLPSTNVVGCPVLIQVKKRKVKSVSVRGRPPGINIREFGCAVVTRSINLEGTERRSWKAWTGQLSY